MSGKCAYGAELSIPNEWRTETFEDGTKPVLKLLPQNAEKTKNYRITMPETLSAENQLAENKESFILKGKMNLLNIDDATSKYKTGFQYSTNSDMSQPDSTEVIGNYDPATLYMSWEKTLDESDLEPNTTYYYRAYMYDGFSYCFGEIKSFTTKGDAEAYTVLNGDTLTFYYDNMKNERTGIKYEIAEKYSNVNTPLWEKNSDHIKIINIDTSFFYYTPTSTVFWFYGLENLTTIINLKNINTTNVTDMRVMFYGCSSLTSLDLSSFDTSKVTDLSGVFRNCSSLTSLDISSFDTSKVIGMAYMFYGCSSLTSLDLSSFDTSNVMHMNDMFYGCSSLTSLDLSNFDTSKVTDMRWMFSGCSSLTSLDLSNFDTSNVAGISGMFCNCKFLTTLDISSFDTSKVTAIGGVNSMDSMFSGCSSLTSLDLSSFDTSEVTDMRWMFYGCSSLTSLDLSSFDTSNVTNMGAMFDGCSSLTSLDLSSFDTSNVRWMGSMFYGCSSLTSLDLSNFDTSNVMDMSAMFCSCNSLTSLDLSIFDTSKVTDMRWIFYGCSSLKTIYAGNWTRESYERSALFLGCDNLRGGKGTKIGENIYYDEWGYHSYYCSDDIDAAHVDGGKDNPGLFTAK